MAAPSAGNPRYEPPIEDALKDLLRLRENALREGHGSESPGTDPGDKRRTYPRDSRPPIPFGSKAGQ